MTKTLVTAGQSVIVQNLGGFLPSIFFRTYVNQMSVVQKLKIKKFITEELLHTHTHTHTHIKQQLFTNIPTMVYLKCQAKSVLGLLNAGIILC